LRKQTFLDKYETHKLSYCGRRIWHDPSGGRLNKARTEKSNLDPDFTFLTNIDLSSDAESESDEDDALNLSCHGNDLKRIREEPKHFEFVMIRRKLSIQLELMYTDLIPMAFNDSKTISEEPSEPLGSVSCDKRSRERRWTNAWTWSLILSG